MANRDQNGGAKNQKNDTTYPDGRVKLRNPNIELMHEDVLYHLALGSGSHDLIKMFGDVKFVCMGGAPERMEAFANYIMKEIKYELPTGSTLLDLTANSHRYSMYKVGPILSVSHGMGISSISILLNEIIKLMYHARVKDPIFIRIGTCGGIGVEGGTVIVSDGAVDGRLNEFYEMPVMDKMIRRPAILNQQLAQDIKACADSKDPYEVVNGKTMCTSDFYEGQGRLDGAFCQYNKQDKMAFLTKLMNNGVINVEMEATTFAALTHHAGIKGAIVCVAFLNRFNGDQVTMLKDILIDWQVRPQKLVATYIKRCLKIN